MPNIIILKSIHIRLQILSKTTFHSFASILVQGRRHKMAITLGWVSALRFLFTDDILAWEYSAGLAGAIIMHRYIRARLMLETLDWSQDFTLRMSSSLINFVITLNKCVHYSTIIATSIIPSQWLFINVTSCSPIYHIPTICCRENVMYLPVG